MTTNGKTRLVILGYTVGQDWPGDCCRTCGVELDRKAFAIVEETAEGAPVNVIEGYCSTVCAEQALAQDDETADAGAAGGKGAAA